MCRGRPGLVPELDARARAARSKLGRTARGAIRGLFGNNRARFVGFDFPALELPVGEERPAGSSWPKSSFLLLDTFLLMSGRHVSGPPTCRPSMAWPSCRATARTWARGRSRKPRLAPATRARPVSILAANHGEPVQTFATKLWFHWPQHASCSMLGPRQVRHCLPCVCLLAENSLLRAHSRPKRSPAGETVSDPLTPRRPPHYTTNGPPWLAWGGGR